MKKILIVDDQYGIRLLLSEVFKKEGYQTFIAAEGGEALTIVEDNKIDIAILDMKMPKMNGIEILKCIKETDRSIKVIMMTAYGEIENINEAKKHGILKLFFKPFDIEHLKSTVNEILRVKNLNYEKGEIIAEM